MEDAGRGGAAAGGPDPPKMEQAGRYKGGEVAEKGPVLPRTGEEYSLTSSPTLPEPGVAEKCRGGFLKSGLKMI